ncbi:MAG: alginate O-acetyltransferase AlgF [Rhodospirillales bacterium]|nr:alginate O-acetyltransferase AlgF [Rhodospirillales bacterium]
MIRILRAAVLCAALIPVFLATAVAQAAGGPDDGLYAPLPPEGSAFVRFVQADPTIKEDQNPAANGKTYDGRDFATVSPYYVVPKGKTDFAFGAAKTEQALESGKFYTVALVSGAKLVVLEDKAADNRAKAMIQFYNFSTQDGLMLKTADEKVEIVPPALKNASGSREINAVKVALSVFGEADSGSEPIGDVVLERGKALGIFAFDDGASGVRAISVEASTDTTK